MNQNLPARTLYTRTIDHAQNYPVAARQWVKELEQRAAQAELDEVYRAKWLARQPAVKQAAKRERKTLIYGFIAAGVFGLVAALGAVFLLAHLGVPIGVAILLALLIGPGTGGSCCTVIVQVFH